MLHKTRCAKLDFTTSQSCLQQSSLLTVISRGTLGREFALGRFSVYKISTAKNGCVESPHTLQSLRATIFFVSQQAKAVLGCVGVCVCVITVIIIVVLSRYKQLCFHILTV